MIWYELKKNNDEYIIFKNVKTDHALGCRGIFHGSKSLCLKYCNENNIKLGYNNKIALNKK